MYKSADEDVRNDLVLQHVPLVKRIAYHLLNRLPPSVQLDDLVQAGVVGLLDAARNFDPSQGASFETYAGIRIRGSMFDETRRNDWTPRSVHRKTRMVSEAVRTVENRTGHDAKDLEVANELNISLDEYHRILQDATGARIFSLNEIQSAEGSSKQPDSGEIADPLRKLQDSSFKKSLVDTINKLPEREKLVISLYYDEELNLREIGEVLNVSESRVCQIHSQAVIRLRSRMSDWLD